LVPRRSPRVDAARFAPSLSPLELAQRRADVYALFAAALRLSGKRELGQFTIFDLDPVLFASYALQPVIRAPDASIPDTAISSPRPSS